MIHNDLCLIFNILCLAIVALLGLVASQDSAESSSGQSDLVKSLPNYTGDYSKIGHYSGYLKGDDNTFLYYWFFQSKSNKWKNDPVVAWFAGGPGESSVAAAMSWFGPVSLHLNGSLNFNHSHSNYTWTHKANMLFIETPVGVGFSYQIRPETNTSDAQTAKHNYNAVKDFFTKFPQLKFNDFYLASYSYASVYISLLGVRLAKDKFLPNFKGVLVESGVFNHSHLTAAVLEYSWRVGIFESSYLAPLIQSCCPVRFCTFRECALTLQCAFEDSSTCCIEYRETYRHYKEHLFFYKFDEGKQNDPKAYQPHLEVWLQNESVKQALKINKLSNKWSEYNRTINMEHLRDFIVLESVKILLENGIRVFAYYGDSDLIVNYYNGLWLIDYLSDKLQTVQPISGWNFEGKMAGYKGQYLYANKTNLTFMVIRDAGHSVFYYKPEMVFQLFS